MSEDPHTIYDEDEDTSPKDAKPWLNQINQATKQFKDYQERGDRVDKLYADADKLAATGRDRAFQLFWANIQVMAPSIYARPPVPVVVPRFKDRRPVPRLASEILERTTSVVFATEDIDTVMRLVRDDLAIQSRGAARVRLDGDWICIDHIDRHDFLCDPARNWKECGWVAFRAWLTEDEMEDRFPDADLDDVAYTINKDAKDAGANDAVEKCAVWEVWSKVEKKVIWVTEGAEKVLDEADPILKLDGFFPCPRPAFGTIQRGSMIPVQDIAFYKDQLEEIDQLTARIAVLTEAVKVRGFYAGGSENADALERAVASADDGRTIIPVPNWAALTTGNSDPIIWLPIDQVVKAIQAMVELRRQIIDDVYQITGLSDIMRGATDPNETLGAQELKAQAGSVRVRDKQNELVRFARDLAVLVAEIAAEEFSKEDLITISQMEVETDADIAKERKALKAQRDQIAKGIAGAQADPQIAQLAQQNPEQAQQMLQQAQEQLAGIDEQIEKLEDRPTIEKVVKLLREERTRPFILDIQTDSTISPDENAEKQRTNEFMTAIGGLLSQLAPMIQAQPQTAGFAGELLKHGLRPYRAGRELETAVDELVEQMKGQAQQPQPNPEADAAKAAAEAEHAKLQMEQQRMEADMQMKQADAQLRKQEAQAKVQFAQMESQERMKAIQADAQLKASESEIRVQQLNAKGQMDAMKHAQDMERGTLEMAKMAKEMERIDLQTQSSLMTTQASIEAKKDASP